MDLHLPILVHVATADDIPRMIELERSCNTAAHWSETQYRDLLLDQSTKARIALVAERKEKPEFLGFLIARCLTPEWELENIVVAPEIRGHGIGIRLTQAFVVHAQQANSDSIFLEVRESNSPARRLYEKLGFRETGRRRAYYSNPAEDAILYGKTLR